MIRQAQVRWKTMKEHSGWYSLLSWPWTPVFGRLTPWIFTKPCSTTLLLSASFAIRKYPQGEIASNASFISLDTPLYPGLGHVGFLMPQFSSVTQSCLTLQPRGLQHARFPCPSPTPGACSNSFPSSQWCHPTISSSVIPFSSCPESLPASESFPVSQFFAWGGQSIGISASASVLPMNIQDWFP